MNILEIKMALRPLKMKRSCATLHSVQQTFCALLNISSNMQSK